jgi:hypothetical protein
VFIGANPPQVIEDAGDVIKLKPVCDNAVLGKRLGKAFAAIQVAVKAMSQKDLNSFSQSGKAVVNGETLTLGEDVKIVYEVASTTADIEATSFLGAVALFHTKLRFPLRSFSSASIISPSDSAKK